MDRLTIEQLAAEMSNFLDEQGSWQDFYDWMINKGYTTEEIDNTLDPHL